MTALLRDGKDVRRLDPEEEGWVVLDETPFYAEAGGQVGDRGRLVADGTGFEVTDTQRHGDAIMHIGVVTGGALSAGAVVEARVDAGARRATARNHSATHLVHAALRAVLGEHVEQKGSLVAPDRLRFDFSHYEPVTKEEIRRIEAMVSAWVLDNDEARTEVMPLEEARRSGAIALFGEKYDDPVRVLSLGDYSVELCGGTHVSRAGDVGLFKIVSEGGIAAGVRRIVALTGEEALAWLHSLEDRIERISRSMKADTETVAERVEAMLARSRELERDLERLKTRVAASHGDDLVAQGRRHRRAQGARGEDRRGGAQGAPRDRRSAQEPARVRGGGARHGQRRQGRAGCRGDEGLHRPHRGGHAREPCRATGRRARRRASGACAGRGQRPVPGGPGHQLRPGVGARAARGRRRRVMSPRS